MAFDLHPKEVSKSERLPGATPQQIQEKIEHFKGLKERCIESDSQSSMDMLETIRATYFEDLRRMAKGGFGDSDLRTITHQGGVDEKGEYAEYTEDISVRDGSYPGWRDEDFVTLLEALGEPSE